MSQIIEDTGREYGEMKTQSDLEEWELCEREISEVTNDRYCHEKWEKKEGKWKVEETGGETAQSTGRVGNSVWVKKWSERTA
jgi:hypothetical protein